MNPALTSLWAFADRAGLELAVWSWQALILLACVWLGLPLFRLRMPALRQQVWFISLLAVLSLPLWPLVLPKSPRAQEHAWKSPALGAAAELPRLVILTVERPIEGPIEALRPTEPKKHRVAEALPVVFCGWIAGALFALFRSARGYLRLRAASSNACPVTAEELGLSLFLPGSLSLKLSAEVRSPVLIGLRRPVILLPLDLAEWTSAEERAAMVAHELAHLARLDHFTNLLPNALNAIFFFHPLVRYACRHFCLEREMACDDRVIGHGADAAVYAESLVKAAERSLESMLADLASPSFHQPAFFTARQALERRIEMILNTDRARVLARGWRYLILPALLIFALAGLLVPNRPASAQQLQKKFDGERLNGLLALGQKPASARKNEPPPPPPPPPKPVPQIVFKNVARKPQNDANDENMVRALLHQSLDAYFNHDADFYERIYADDFQGIGVNGELLTKGQIIADVKNPMLKLTKFEIDDLKLRGEGNSMLMTYLGTAFYMDHNEEKIIRLRYTDILFKRQGSWQWIGSHISLVR